MDDWSNADFSYSLAQETDGELQRLKRRVEALEEWVGRIAQSVQLLCKFLEKK